MMSSNGNLFPRYWLIVRWIHRSPVNSAHKGQWRGALVFSLICVWINSWANNGEAGDLRRYRAHHDIIVMWLNFLRASYITSCQSSVYNWQEPHRVMDDITHTLTNGFRSQNDSKSILTICKVKHWFKVYKYIYFYRITSKDNDLI